jgi:hypothetical protein
MVAVNFFLSPFPLVINASMSLWYMTENIRQPDVTTNMAADSRASTTPFIFKSIGQLYYLTGQEWSGKVQALCGAVAA